jgi:hypothetical protein
MGAGERRGVEHELGQYPLGCAHDPDYEQHRCELPHVLDPFVGRRIDTPDAAMLTPCRASGVAGVTMKKRQGVGGRSRLVAARKSRSVHVIVGRRVRRRRMANSCRRTAISSSLRSSLRNIYRRQHGVAADVRERSAS